MLLADAIEQKSYRIQRMDLPADLRRQLTARGITDRAMLYILHKKASGSAVILCRAGRFALGSYYTRRIHLEREI